jgi:phage/plasmid-associated DNA primase
MGRNGYNADTAAFLNFINVLFDGTEGPVNLCTLRNGSGGAGPQITSNNSADLKKFVTKHDRPGWGVYACVSTMVDAKHHHAKESIRETPSLHTDIDLKDLALDTKEDIVRKLKALRLPPSVVVDSGNGVHCYWRFKEACSADDIEHIESALKLLCDLVGGDIKVTHPAAVMRLPGTHNTKHEGQNHLVIILEQNDNVYELDDLEEWLSEASPIILRKERPQAKTVGEDGSMGARYERLNKDYKPPINWEKRLNQMMYMGEGDASIHETQIQVSASLLQAGVDVEDIIELLMEATRAAASDYGKRWNWTRGKHSEEARLRNMCETWLKKHPKKQRANSKSDDPSSGSAGSQSSSGPHPQSTSGPATVKDRVKDKTEPFYIRVAKEFFVDLDNMGHDLRIFVDSKGNEHLWSYVEGKWSLVMNIDAWLDGQIEDIIQHKLKADNKSSNRVCAEARKYILRSPNVRKNQSSKLFDQHGKIPVKGVLIDPITLKAEPIRKEHYCTWELDIVYDKNAKCPWWLRMLDDTFSDRTEEEKKERIGLLQEMMGVSLIDNKNKELRRALVIIGESNSGKSALLDVQSDMITDEPITTPIADLNNTHGVQAFIRRAPWILHEAFDQSTWHISSKAKQILGGNVFEINPKGKNAISVEFTGPARFATNHPPKFRESTKAMITRMILLHTTFVFEGEEIGAAAEARKHGYQEPQKFVVATEKSGILNWMLIGAQRAMKEGKFSDTEEGKEALHDIRLDSNLAAGFVEECMDFDPSIRISVPDFNAAFMSWWKENHGDDRTVSPDQIGRALKALSHAKIAIDRHKFKDEKGLRYICGVELNEAGRAHWQNKSDEISAPSYGGKSDLARMSSSITSIHSKIPPGKNWWDHPLVVKIRDNAAKEKTKPKF